MDVEEPRNLDKNTNPTSVVVSAGARYYIAYQPESITAALLETDALMKRFNVPPRWTLRVRQLRKPNYMKLYPLHSVYPQLFPDMGEDSTDIGSSVHYVWTPPFP